MSDLQELLWYVTFENHSHGLRLFSLIKEEGLSAVIVPTPRKLSRSCGIALMLRAEEVEAVRTLVQRTGAEILEIASLVKEIDPARDRYC